MKNEGFKLKVQAVFISLMLWLRPRTMRKWRSSTKRRRMILTGHRPQNPGNLLNPPNPNQQGKNQQQRDGDHFLIQIWVTVTVIRMGIREGGSQFVGN